MTHSSISGSPTISHQGTLHEKKKIKFLFVSALHTSESRVHCSERLHNSHCLLAIQQNTSTRTVSVCCRCSLTEHALLQTDKHSWCSESSEDCLSTLTMVKASQVCAAGIALAFHIETKVTALACGVLAPRSIWHGLVWPCVRHPSSPALSLLHKRVFCNLVSAVRSGLDQAGLITGPRRQRHGWV